MSICIDRAAVKRVSLSGRGGRESVLRSIFKGDVYRNSSPLSDLVVDGVDVELKRQSGLQWFDHGKYHNLSAREQDILMVFVMHKESAITSIHAIRLGAFIQTATHDPVCMKDGWTSEEIRDAYKKKRQFPKLQYKLPLNIRAFIERHSEAFTRLF
jgi:hypothetical protein